LENALKRFGYVPLSLKMFYTIVGSCNFGWDYDTRSDIPWVGADPIAIIPVSDLLDEVKEYEADDDNEPIGITVAADYYHKDNISGGAPYSIELTSMPSVDSRFLDEEHDTTFINYLRIALSGGGFSRFDTVTDLPDFMDYFEKVKPKLKPI
jgi:hypothetical protein